MCGLARVRLWRHESVQRAGVTPVVTSARVVTNWGRAAVTQICLVTGHTFGMPDMVFATGDTSLQTFVQVRFFSR